MPIYEYYCKNCHVILNFYSRTLTPAKTPSCPHCGWRRLKRQVSAFSAGSKGGAGEDAGLDGLAIDEVKMEQAMEALSAEAATMNEDDPRAAAQLMRKFSKVAGMEFNEGIEQALQRLEAGEDPEAVEAEMGETLDDADPFVSAGGGKNKIETKGNRIHQGAPRHDSTLYDL